MKLNSALGTRVVGLFNVTYKVLLKHRPLCRFSIWDSLKLFCKSVSTLIQQAIERIKYIFEKLSELLPWKPFGMFLPGVISWLPVPQPSIAVETFDVVTMTCDFKKTKNLKNEYLQLFCQTKCSHTWTTKELIGFNCTAYITQEN